MVNPWHEKHVAKACLDRACSWKQLIGKAVPHGAEPKLVTTFLFLEKGKDAKRAFPCFRVMVNPCKDGRHLSVLPPYSHKWIGVDCIKLHSRIAPSICISWSTEHRVQRTASRWCRIPNCNIARQRAAGERRHEPRPDRMADTGEAR